jgi:ribosomal protein S5
MLLTGQLLGGAGSLGEAGGDLSTVGLTVLVGSAGAVAAGPLVTSAGLRRAGVDVTLWPGWTGAGIMLGSLVLPIAGQLDAVKSLGDTSTVLNVAAFAGLLGGGVMVQVQDGINRRELHMRAGPGGVQVFGAF